MSFLQIALPGAILVMAFCLKLFVDRRAEVPDIISALFELPVDVSFLATSFIAAFIISGQDQAHDGLLYFVFYVVGAVVVVVCWRRGLDLFTKYKYGVSLLLGASGYLLCMWGLYHAINLVSGVTP